MPVKVCILTTVHQVFDVRIFYKQAKTLVQAGYKVTLIAQHDKDEIVDGVRIVALPKPKNRFIRIFVLIWRVFYLALSQKADVYHFHDPELIIVGIILRILGKKVIYDIHEDISKQILSKYWIPNFLKKFISFYVKKIEIFSVSKFSKIICATPFISDNFKFSNKINIVQNYPITKVNKLSNIKPYNLRDNQIVYIGDITKIRGIYDILKSIEISNEFKKKNYKLVLVGRFSPESILDDLKKMTLWERVNYLGWKSPEDVNTVLNNGKIGMLIFHPVPNHIESQPNKLYEYMLAGLPVVASNFPYWESIIKKYQCGILVNPLLPEDIASGIDWLIKNPDEAEKMGIRGRKAILKEYNWENESKKLLNIYKELLPMS